jgi:hypothetical protein
MGINTIYYWLARCFAARLALSLGRVCPVLLVLRSKALAIVARCRTPVPMNVLHNILSHSAQEYSNDLTFATFTEY